MSDRLELHRRSTALERLLPTPERVLFAKMSERADSDSPYAGALLQWLRRGSTSELRDLCEPFGRYWRDLQFANAVDGLDSLRLRAA